MSLGSRLDRAGQGLKPDARFAAENDCHWVLLTAAQRHGSAAATYETGLKRSVVRLKEVEGQLGAGSAAERVEPSLDSALQFVGAHVPEVPA